MYRFIQTIKETIVGQDLLFQNETYLNNSNTEGAIKILYSLLFA